MLSSFVQGEPALKQTELLNDRCCPCPGQYKTQSCVGLFRARAGCSLIRLFVIVLWHVLLHVVLPGRLGVAEGTFFVLLPTCRACVLVLSPLMVEGTNRECLQLCRLRRLHGCKPSSKEEHNVCRSAKVLPHFVSHCFPVSRPVRRTAAGTWSGGASALRRHQPGFLV